MSEQQADFQKLTESLQKASALMNDIRYFRLPVGGREDPIYRERVYCYELYHQLRRVLEDESGFRYSLHGEVDKRTHPIIAKRCGEKIPDLLIHVPGRMDHNLAVIEVKPSTARRPALKQDIEKLVCYVRKASYYRGIMLIYGHGDDDSPRSVGSAKKLIETSPIVLMWHKGPGQAIETKN